ncbi:MAG TPA: glutathione S-transferase [Byssovorax sp.]
MIVVHHLNNSRSQRVLWLLEELGLEYEIKRYERDPKTHLAPRELRAVHPLGKSPVVSDGSETVAESGAIIEYVVDRHGRGRLRPADGTKERLRYTYFMHYAEGSLMPPLLVKFIFEQIRKSPAPFFVRPIIGKLCDKVGAAYIRPNLELHADFLEGELGTRAWFAGDELTAADVQMSYPVEAARSRGAVTDAHPKLAAWLERVHARPAFKRALERGGPYEIG